MFRFIVFAGGLFFMCTTARSELYEFKTPDGKSVKAEIADYNARVGKVTLKREDGRRVDVKPSIFTEEGQVQIKEWVSAQAFTSDKQLKITCDDKVVEEWKEEEYRDLTDTEGNTEQYLMKETMFERVAYDIEFQNMNAVALDNIRMEYRIYYEQSKETRGSPVAEQKVFKGEMELPVLVGKKKTPLSTESIEIYTDSINSISWADGSARVGGKGKAHGLRARLYMTTASGNEIVRTFCHPGSLSDENFPW